MTCINSVLPSKAITFTNYSLKHEKSYLISLVSIVYLLNPKAEHTIQSP